MRPNTKSTYNGVCYCVHGARIASYMDISTTSMVSLLYRIIIVKQYNKLLYHKHAPKPQKVHTVVSVIVYMVLRLGFGLLFARTLWFLCW